MNRVVASAVNPSGAAEVNLIVDRDGPEVDEDEEDRQQSAVNRKNECHKIVRHSLSPPVHRMESV